MTSARLDVLFGDSKVVAAGSAGKRGRKAGATFVVPPQGPFPTATQRELGLEAMKMLGFDFNGGRLDVSAHPFCGGVPGRYCALPRYDEDELLSALFGVIHETGHALQTKPAARMGRSARYTLARSATIKVRSLFFEMQLGRSEAFLKHLLPAVHARFGSRGGVCERTLSPGTSA